ncbi:MAG: response regulator [Alphaproteobacteria bacterium]|nr:response regulator [Alphaproteobacteria bacterium]
MSNPQHDNLIRALPYARRYARALSGSQVRGDGLVADSLKDMLSGDEPTSDPRAALYTHVTRRFDRLAGPGTPEIGLRRKQRQLLLLTSLEEMPIEGAAPVVGLDLEFAKAELADARDRLRASAATDVLIIEDEPIIAMDIEELVQGCGHRVVGVASTERDAVDIARRTRPGLILADINLGAGGDGANAVSRILQSHHVPVIFVTAYPERLLTGEEVEPAFVITKPFEPIMLAVATYQAVTGGVHLD